MCELCMNLDITSTVQVLVWHLAVVIDQSGDNKKLEDLDGHVRLAVRAVPPGGVCNVGNF